MTDYECGIGGMKGALSDHQMLIAGFVRKKYVEVFQKYYLSLEPALEAIEHLYQTVVDKETMLDNMARALVESSKEIMARTSKRDRETVTINLSLVMAGYVYPALLRYKGSSSRPLVDQVSRAWKAAYPKSNITPAEYEVIEQGFHKKFCFITTACCRQLGKPDDCYELTLLRRYRDTYMAALPDGEDLIALYYDIAPTIVKHIDRRSDSGRIYDGIWKTYIQPCIRLIEAGSYEACLDLYRTMVMTLKEEFFYTRASSAVAVAC